MSQTITNRNNNRSEAICIRETVSNHRWYRPYFIHTQFRDGKISSNVMYDYHIENVFLCVSYSLKPDLSQIGNHTARSLRFISLEKSRKLRGESSTHKPYTFFTYITHNTTHDYTRLYLFLFSIEFQFI